MRTLATVLLVTLLASSAHAEPQTLEQWRERRVTNLTSESGWLTLVGLFWLREGDNTFGRAKSNRITLSHPALAGTLGSFAVKDGKVTFVGKPGVDLTHQDKPVTSIEMIPDTAGEPTMLATGSLRFFVIERTGRLGVRVRDVNHAARKHFQGIEYFPENASWIVDAKFEPYPEGRRIPIVNILGMTDQMITPGAVVFTKGGREWRLDTILEAPGDEELFLMFADATSARETYGAGRFIYIPLPRDGRVTIDFNRAYNPPCAFNEFATCPLPPAQNRLGVRVDAGEKKYVGAH